MKLTPILYLNELKEKLQQEGDPTYAEKQMNYMKDHFPFYGLNAKAWGSIFKNFFKEHGIFQGEELRTFVKLCNEEEYREVHYLGIEMAQKAQKKEDETFVEFLEEMILANSWWDSVDWISKLVMLHFKKFPHQISEVTRKWIASENMWLNRIAIIFQRYKNYPTDFDLLKKYILQHEDSREFFIQKAQGWALRDYSKIDGKAVIEFINENPQLSNLTKREALKWLKTNGLYFD